MPTDGRARLSKAERRQRNQSLKWDPEDNSWHKYAKCGLCDAKFVVNNYADRKVRVNQYKIGGVIVCPWCRGRNGRFMVQLLKIAQQVTLEDCQRRDKHVGVWWQSKANLIAWEDSCKCLPCQSRRILGNVGKLTMGMK